MSNGELPAKKPKLELGVNYKERKDNPPPGLVWRRPFDIVTKEAPSLGNIADVYGITWQDLALINFGTINPVEINWYLHNRFGCTKHNGTNYIFSRGDTPGYLLVPEKPPSAFKGMPTQISVVRGGTVKKNTQLWFHIVERKAHGPSSEVSGKWLYVFSGGGLDFGRKQTVAGSGGGAITIRGPISREIPPPGDPEDYFPQSAFSLDFQGLYPLSNGPDRLDYEIYITGDTPPSQSLFKTFTGRGFDPKEELRCKMGGYWYVLSDQKILSKATSAPRHTRTNHALRNQTHIPLNLIEKGKARRYYFLLSSIQLGPKAIEHAMNNPDGLTPLLKPHYNREQWDPENPSKNKVSDFVGPEPSDYKSKLQTIAVIDPYAWAEDVVQNDMADKVDVYQKWLKSTKNVVIDALKVDTKWTQDQYYLANLLRTVRDDHPKPDTIDDEIRDVSGWTQKLEQWNNRLVKRGAEYTADAHRSMHRLIKWIDGPGHAIIDKTVLEDMVEDGWQDAIDVAIAVLHWAIVTEALIPLKPGIESLQKILGDGARVPHQCFFKYFDAGQKPKNKSLHTGLKISYIAALKLLGLRDFVGTGTNRSRSQLAADIKRRRDEIIKNLNKMEIVPCKIKPVQVHGLSSGAKGLAGVALLGFLDVGDKLTTYIVDKNIDIPKKFGLGWLRKLEEISDLRFPKTANAISQSFSWGLKGAAGILAYLNLMSTINTARFDFQHDPHITDWGSSISAMIIAVQDVVSGVAGLLGGAAIFPEVTTTTSTVGWTVTEVSGAFATGWAFANVFAIMVLGAATAWAMWKKAWDAYDNGDSTAMAFYFVAASGGVSIFIGGLLLGLGLMKVGGLATATIYGAPVGLVLFVAGGVIAAIGAILGWIFSTDDAFAIFARRCFLGENSGDSWNSPDSWSGISSIPPPWSVDKQISALYNLLSRFVLTTKPLSTFDNDVIYRGKIEYTIKPGILPPGSRLEVALHYGEKGPSDSVVFLAGETHPKEYKAGGRLILTGRNSVQAAYQWKNGNIAQINLKADVRYDSNLGGLGTTVSVLPKGFKNKVTAKKGIMKEGLLWGENIDDASVVSDGFYRAQ
ncbi:hypothetical protein DSCO28_38950 [Desulfosarcina ovata subsp. sediminis]|uniref:LysM domain-containing protein n=1 Tax=Desulfosarcina ovata subsp. sediminis TaxID=885957 RepID=A0A5K7ZT00_9BACT|nr:hypothetical protein [Desulfosarcina ovata]BBO83329.1 hypothetical protein DSCO28_38950 [Desulfosarcina ovata subsp. sediminis]